MATNLFRLCYTVAVTYSTQLKDGWVPIAKFLNQGEAFDFARSVSVDPRRLGPDRPLVAVRVQHSRRTLMMLEAERPKPPKMRDPVSTVGENGHDAGDASVLKYSGPLPMPPFGSIVRSKFTYFGNSPHQIDAGVPLRVLGHVEEAGWAYLLCVELGREHLDGKPTYVAGVDLEPEGVPCSACKRTGEDAEGETCRECNGKGEHRG